MDQNKIDDLLLFRETHAPDRIKDFGLYYAENFKDPFNEVNRLEDIRENFARMFQQVADPRFVVSEKWDTGEELYAKLPLIGGAVRFLRRAFS